MAEIVGLVAELFVGLAKLFPTIIGVLLQGLHSGVADLLRKPKEGESWFTAKRKFAAPIYFSLFFGGLFVDSLWCEHVRRSKTLATLELVEHHARKLVGEVDEDGALVKIATSSLNIHDAWGNPLRVDYRETLTAQRVTVISLGDDARIGTLDDISSSQRLPR